MMSQWLIMFGIAVVTGIAFAIPVILLYRRRMRQLLSSMDDMLNSAIDDDFSEGCFDESALSAVETKLARFLAFCAVSSKNLTNEKENIESLISDISHQTKTAVANILLYTQLLEEERLPQDCVEYVNTLSAQAKKLDFLIQALVKTSRLESGIITVQPQRDSVQKLLERAITQVSPRAKEKEITIQLESTDGIAYYDPKWTIEAVYNVLDNAVKYSPMQGSIKIKTIPYELFFRIDITDQGIGITEDEQSKIFTRFYRSSATNVQEGMGLGLFLAREILSTGGGYIKVASKLGQGSTFSIFLAAGEK
ncbi:two-component sensor histidine kinase [Virgibacillus sp. 6R]|nr:two-component sensor histidine kinase [Virgibacillus sp. 6R]